MSQPSSVCQSAAHAYEHALLTREDLDKNLVDMDVISKEIEKRPLTQEEIEWCQKFIEKFRQMGFEYKGFVKVPSARHAWYIYDQLGPQGRLLVLGWNATEEEIQQYERPPITEYYRRCSQLPTIRTVSPALHPLAQLPQAVRDLKSTISRQEAHLSRKDRRAHKSSRKNPKRSKSG